MKSIRRILVAVKNPERPHRAVIDKAIQLAKSLGASVEFFHAISDTVTVGIQPRSGETLAEIRRDVTLRRQKKLDRLIDRACDLRVESSATVEWDFPPHEAIVRRAARCKADLIVAECHEGRRIKWFMRLTDWELLRASPVPVLLLTSGKPWRNNVVLAAVDPTHAHAKPSRLDTMIVAQGRRLAKGLGGALHLMHAAYPAAFGVTISDSAIDAALLAMSFEKRKAEARRAFTEFAERRKIPGRRRHFIDRDPATGIRAVAQSIGADVVVMGAVSRSGVKGLLIGNTAEKVICNIPCDILVVKPANFEKKVPAASRGMHVISPLPHVPMPI